MASRMRQQADARDKASTPYKMAERQQMYKVGSVFKGCRHCDSHQVFRSNNTARTGWTHWCWDCGSKDEDAWVPAATKPDNRLVDEYMLSVGLKPGSTFKGVPQVKDTAEYIRAMEAATERIQQQIQKIQQRAKGATK